MTFHKGVLWIKGEAKEEENLPTGKAGKKKYYRKATSSFSYRVAIPGDVDSKAEPQASVKHGVMTVAFTKSPAAQPKKIAVKTG